MCYHISNLLLLATFALVKPISGDLAVFAMGCFWCGEQAMEAVPGVEKAVSGYCGGSLPFPTYRNHEGHLEVVRVTFDPKQVNYTRLLYYFWHNIDPLDSRGQFCDKGNAYKSAILCDESQCPLAEKSLKELQEARPRWKIATTIRPLTQFWDAEEYHQDYYKKNAGRYAYYKKACKRVERLKAVWGDESYEESHKDDHFNAEPEDPWRWLKILGIVVGSLLALACVIACGWMMLVYKRGLHRNKASPDVHLTSLTASSGN